MMNVAIQKLLLFFYLGLFSYFISNSVIRYYSGVTVKITNLKDTTDIQYPSISVCTKYTSKKVISIASNLFSNESLNFKKKLISESIWNKSEVFYFVSHPGMLGMRFPCVTINDGDDPGKPCLFPFR